MQDEKGKEMTLRRKSLVVDFLQESGFIYALEDIRVLLPSISVMV